MSDKPVSTETTDLNKAREDFVSQWGALGSAWGINRTMAQIHALLLVTPSALSTDDVMEQLQISRGNAHGNLRDLIGWGLIRSVFIKGDRKEYFEAEKDVWKIFCTVVRERKRREIRPALAVLQDCADRTAQLKTPEAIAFHQQMAALGEFVQTADNMLSKIARMEQSTVMPWVLKWMS